MLRMFFRGLALRARISLWHVCSVHAHISSWRLCSVHASVPYAHAEGIQNEHLKNGKTDVHAEHARKELMYMVRVRICSWREYSVHASVPDPYAQHAHKGQIMCVRKSKFVIIFKVPKTSKILKNHYWHYQMVSKAPWKKCFYQTQKILLKIRLSIRERNFAALNEPLNIEEKNLF